MKVIVAYMSQTGNTKKVAENIFQEIQAEKEIKELGEIDSLEGYDLAFFGFPMIQFGAPKKAQKFLEKHAKDKKVALFITHASPEDFEPLQGWLENCKQATAGANLVGMFNCQGELAQHVMDSLLKSDDPQLRAFGEMGAMTKGQPNAARLERARVFAREIMEKER